MAPSPTGFLHIGNLRSSLYNELFARKYKGTFILRIEDTDRARFVEGAIESLCRVLKLMGIVPDEGVLLDQKGQIKQKGDFGPYVQSERKELHASYAKQLVEMGKAYPCFCTEQELTKMREEQQAAGLPTRYDRHCRSLYPVQAAKRIEHGDEHVIRLALPLKGTVTMEDEIRGIIEFDWKQIDDQVIIKSDGMPTYHLAATCDDHDMNITHVIRGEEWLPSTPKHLFIYEAFGWKPPKFAHLPLLLNTDHTKLSKRQGDVAVEDYLGKGYLPEALLNFVALLGWNPTGDREIYTHDELKEMFDLHKVNKGGAVVNLEKLDWLNAQYVRSLPKERYLELANPYLKELSEDTALIDRVALLVREHVIKLTDLPELCKPFLKKDMDVDPLMVPWKSQTKRDVLSRLQAVEKCLNNLPEKTWDNVQKIEKTVKELIERNGWTNGETLWPLRVALSGQKQSPGPFELLHALGRERSLLRVQKTVKLLS
jgi:glutamyl-tRNA synthetase